MTDRIPKPPPLPARIPGLQLETDLDLEPFQVAGPEEKTAREGMLRDPRDVLISSLQQELHTLKLLQQTPSTPPPSFEPEPPPETRPSLRLQRKQQVVSISKLLGKWSFVLGLMPFVGAAVVKLWPQAAAPVDFVLQLLGQLQ